MPPSHFNHDVQFYESESFLCETVVRFLGDGLKKGDPLVAIVTPEHREAFSALLKRQGFDVESSIADKQFVFLDARQTLSTFMNGSMPEADLFTGGIGNVIDRSQAVLPHSTVRAFGEMVDVLWRDGNREAAIRVEELWNELACSRSFSLLCTYTMANFDKSSYSQLFREICRQHVHVTPTEFYMNASDQGARLREISFLEQRARSLENEIERRKVLEKTLRDALIYRERVEAEREALLAREQAARENAETASRLKDEFLAILSHELRTPLNAILGWLQVVDWRRDEPTINNALDVIRRNATLQLHLIDDLLDVSRIVTGKMSIKTGPVDLVTLLHESADNVRPAAAAKSIQLDLQIDEDVRFITGDSNRLQQVIWNLLTNAIKFTPKEGRVELRLTRGDSHVQIIVRDTGQGIDPEFLPHVFDRFRQAEGGTTRRYGGLGLGLAVVRYLVEAHGGTVCANSRGIGLGATFVVTLPIHMPAEVFPSEEGRPQQGGLLKAFNILVVEDERDTRELFKFVLEEAGAVVEAAASVDEALDLVSSRSFDLMIGDIGMPGRDGYSLIAAIRNHSSASVREIPAIAVTSYAGEDYKTKALDAGYDDYLTKPIEPLRLAQTVSEQISKRIA